jgi:hypothetical protein
MPIVILNDQHRDIPNDMPNIPIIITYIGHIIGTILSHVNNTGAITAGILHESTMCHELCLGYPAW